MKKIKILLLAGMLCLSVTACKSEDKSTEEQSAGDEAAEDSQKGEDSADLEISKQSPEEQDSVQADKGEYYTLYTEDKQTSIQVKIPVGYQPLEYSTETWLDFESSEKSGHSSSQLIMTLLDKSETEAAEMMKQEVQYASSANATGDVTIEETQSETKGDRQVSYFHYAYTTEDMKTDGYRFWTMLQNGRVFTCTIENKGTGAAVPDIEAAIDEIVSGIQE